MSLSSGTPPYEYATSLPFRACNPYIGQMSIGISGILLEQAQFVITAELRRFLRNIESHALPNFYIYTHQNAPKLGPYEPNALGNTLSSSGSIIFVDYINDLRVALELLFDEYSSDSDFSTQEHKADWLQNAYPTSASGFYLEGQYQHRFPSEVGIIDYMALDVLGSSGVLYDIDFGEVMFNPYPYMAASQSINARGRSSTGSSDSYLVLGAPIFPCFQKTDGSLIGLNGFEPTDTVGLYTRLVEPVSSGAVRLDGYMLKSATEYKLGNGIDFATTVPVFSEGIRSFGAAGNLINSRIFLDTTAISSGVYRILAKNTKTNVPNTAISSGTVSIWPQYGFRYYANAVPTATDAMDEDFANGYHVFDETLWITDRTSNTANIASGLVTLSPWTAHQLWLRYADPQQVTLGGSWGSFHALERTTLNNVIRVHSASIADGTTNLQTYTFHKYDDDLNYISSTTSDGNVNTTAGVGGQKTITDMFYDGTKFYTLGVAGSGMAEFDSSFNYNNSWAVTSNVSSPSLSGCGSRAFFANSKYYFYIPQQPGAGDPTGLGVGGLNMRSSGIIEFSFSTGNRLNLDAIKYVRGEKVFGSNIPVLWRYHDIINVTSSPHLTPGIWALAAIRRAGELTPVNYLLRLEEQSDYWEIMAFMRLNSGSTPDLLGGAGTVDILYMPI